MNALLAEPQSVDALAQSLLRVMRSQPLRERLSLTARQVSRRYDVDEIAMRWDSLLR